MRASYPKQTNKQTNQYNFRAAWWEGTIFKMASSGSESDAESFEVFVVIMWFVLNIDVFYQSIMKTNTQEYH